MMTQDSSLWRMATRLSTRVRSSRAGPPDAEAVAALAQEFGASSDVMAAFVHRFCPVAVETDRFRDSADTMLFVHIPKTAGMSVGKAMQQAFDQFYGVEWNNVGPSFRKLARQAAYTQSKGGTRQVIMGHYGWNELQFWRNQDLPIKSGTVLRDPIQRMISNFNYNSSDAHPAREDFVKRHPTIDSFVRTTGYDVQLTQAIGLVSSFDDVLGKLTQYYSFIGVTERLGQSLAYLSRSHGLPAFTEYHTNVGSKAADDLPEEVRAQIVERNHNDIKIHALMLRLYAMSEEN